MNTINFIKQEAKEALKEGLQTIKLVTTTWWIIGPIVLVSFIASAYQVYGK